MTAPAPTEPAAPTLGAGRYAVGALLGRGGLAVTHQAHDRRLGRWVAVKSLVPDASPELAAAQRSRFVREARALARFDHPGIVRVYEVFEEGGTAHLVMEHLHGRSVAGEVAARGGPLPGGELAALATGVGRALAAVHAAGLLHRDVSPSNVVLVEADGGSGRRPVLIDFGLAREVSDVTEAFTRMVTPGFAPPEQYGGDPARIGPATDVYGLAATLYHAAAGRLPASAVDRQHGARLEPLRKLRPDLPRSFCDGVHDGLELDPDHRPATAAALLARLGLDPGPVVAPTPTPTPTQTPFSSVRTPENALLALENGTGRRWTAVVPLGIGAAAIGALAPLVGVALLAAVVLPVLATVGDLRRGRRRLAVPWRLARNLSASLAAAVPALLLAGGGVCTALLVDRTAPASTADDLAAAIAGAAAALLVARGADADVVDAWSDRARDALLYGAWAVALLLASGAVVLRPELWPAP